MKSFDKKLLVGSAIGLVLGSLSAWRLSYLVTIPGALTSGWNVVEFLFMFVVTALSCVIIFVTILFYISKSLNFVGIKYANAVKVYRNGGVVKFPAFFKFMKWLNTND